MQKLNRVDRVGVAPQCVSAPQAVQIPDFGGAVPRARHNKIATRVPIDAPGRLQMIAERVHTFLTLKIPYFDRWIATACGKHFAAIFFKTKLITWFVWFWVSVDYLGWKSLPDTQSVWPSPLIIIWPSGIVHIFHDLSSLVVTAIIFLGCIEILYFFFD